VPLENAPLETPDDGVQGQGPEHLNVGFAFVAAVCEIFMRALSDLPLQF
jgi:hypothetical protein